MVSKICTQCGRSYQPSSRHLRCPACRSRDLCTCGASKQGKSATCSAWRTVARGASNGRWRGGRTRHKAGYVMTWAPGHPRAGKGNYVCTPCQRSTGRQSSREPRTMDASSTKFSHDMRGTLTPPTMLRVSTEHSWRWRESNPRPSVPHQGFSERSLLCFSQPRRSRRQDADGLSHC